MILDNVFRRGLSALLVALVLLGAATLASPQRHAVAAAGPEIVIDGEPLELDAPARYYDGRLYVPIAPLAERFGGSVSWDGKQEALTVRSAVKDEIVLGNEVPVVYLNGERLIMDAVPILVDGRLYAPLRELTELLHGRMHYDADAEVALLTRIKQVELSAEDTLSSILEAYGLTRQELMRRNNMDAKSEPKTGTLLKVVVPSFFSNTAKPYTEAEYMLLAKITMVEAGYESYEGQLAIANIILNRVAHSKFPDTIREVIYSGRQFPPAHNGLLDKSKPHASALRAAKDALNGRNNVPGAVYFYNPDVTRGEFWSNLTTVTTIGNHRFAK